MPSDKVQVVMGQHKCLTELYAIILYHYNSSLIRTASTHAHLPQQIKFLYLLLEFGIVIVHTYTDEL